MYVIKVIAFANGKPCPFASMYLQEFTPGSDIKGKFTDKVKKAKTYNDMGSALTEWQTSIGTRPDGKPDRPLTAFTVEIVTLESQIAS